MSIELDSSLVQQGGDFTGGQFGAEIPAATGSDEYEFTTYENSVLLTLAGRMKIVGVVSVVFALVQTLAAVVLVRFDGGAGLLRSIVLALLSSILGAMLLASAKEFRAIATTEGSDLAHLMTALGRLSQFFLVQAGLIVVGLGVMALALFVLLMAVGG
jgi:hypothetical protein